MNEAVEKNSIMSKVMMLSIWLFSPIVIVVFWGYQNEITYYLEQLELLPVYFIWPIKIICYPILGIAGLMSWLSNINIYDTVSRYLNGYYSPKKAPEKLIKTLTVIVFILWIAPIIILKE